MEHETRLITQLVPSRRHLKWDEIESSRIWKNGNEISVFWGGRCWLLGGRRPYPTLSGVVWRETLVVDNSTVYATSMQSSWLLIPSLWFEFLGADLIKGKMSAEGWLEWHIEFWQFFCVFHSNYFRYKKWARENFDLEFALLVFYNNKVKLCVLNQHTYHATVSW